ncbi:MAG TPA: twin-arginine translocation signal domain-containing protein [bacterium]|nr:twin-arginine translocation signal domain-containing protein [bacterium]HQL63435.1 twin-arginine translocation signal domain-containing protein [bacterium]
MKEKRSDSVSKQLRRSFLKSSAGVAAAIGLAGSTTGCAGSEKIAAESSGAKQIALAAAAKPPVTLVSSSGGDLNWIKQGWDPQRPFLLWGRPLRVQPILMYATPQPQKQTSWKSWGGVLTEESATEEIGRITEELRALASQAEFPVEFLPAQKVKTPEEAESVRKGNYDIVLVYPAAGSGRLLAACVPTDGNAILFARHRSGPTYYWYEALSVAYLATDDPEKAGGEPPRLGKTHVDDVVIDDYREVLWRLRAWYGVKNMTGARIVALGSAEGKYAGDAPKIAREKFKFEIIEISYEAAEPRIRAAVKDPKRIARAEKWTETYLSMPNTLLKTDRPFVVNAFILYELFKEFMHENNAPAFTIRSCMGTIMPMSETTACLTLGLLNDEGLIAFCESDFVIIPAGILLRHITGKPVFLHNSTFPHQGVVTCAHCSAPRRMDAVNYDPVTILTHEESDYGAAPKVDIPIGQEVTFIDPEYTKGRWVGIRGNVEGNPFYPICRSQQDVRIQGKWRELLNEARDSHWMMAYGDYLKEIGYAARKLDLRWENVSDV